MKTVWDDKAYTVDEINQMCIDAITQVLRTAPGKVFRNKAGKTLSEQSHNIVVAGTGASRVCIAISDASCFPKVISDASPRALGATCDDIDSN